jgi:tol-pal system protein YbgF
MDRLESEMRELTGRVEEYANRVEQLRRRVEQLNGETELRVDRGSSPTGAGPAPQSPVAMPPTRSGPGGPPRPSRPPTAPERLGSYEDEPGTPPNGPPLRGPTPISGTLTPPGTPSAMLPGTPPGSSPRSNEPASAAAPAPASDGVLPGGSATEQYNYAFGLMKQANYPDAEAAFKEFVAAHPKDQMAGNAQYWLGETYYARGKYMEAASAFAEGYKRYPKSTKTPDVLLKLGMSLARADQKQNACVALAKLGQEFPKAAASVRQRAVAEMKNLGC